ncbi:deoxyribose-phosphate aldolase [Halocella sp. SP3-1]|uniref:deoxyribose-phosphate aldolase n=1 Tax=Halocella sp. SP3-1 TaxID=2382161 RepID=UPI000F74FEF1|nr:deoxyribose-phosphate aldolase [Halocella sp. SP3-1]AZO96637.1 deoxyribose-phosphate aldolase [Halocella sp. SP3-1]
MADLIDHTILKPDATEDEVEKICKEAVKYSFASVCINPVHVPLVSKLLAGTGVKVCTVIAFPLGANTSTIKALEAKEALANGAEEIDMVINIGYLKSGKYLAVEQDIAAVVEAVKEKALVKVIIETALLTEEEKIAACVLASLAGADYVKTSTGFATDGAKVADIKLMRNVVGSQMGVKASGGVRDNKTAKEMVSAGASRIGASASIKIVNEV